MLLSSSGSGLCFFKAITWVQFSLRVLFNFIILKRMLLTRNVLILNLMFPIFGIDQVILLFSWICFHLVFLWISNKHAFKKQTLFKKTFRYKSSDEKFPFPVVRLNVFDFYSMRFSHYVREPSVLKLPKNLYPVLGHVVHSEWELRKLNELQDFVVSAYVTKLSQPYRCQNDLDWKEKYRVCKKKFRNE